MKLGDLQVKYNTDSQGTGSNYGVTYDIDQIPMVEIFVNTPLSNGLKS